MGKILLGIALGFGAIFILAGGSNNQQLTNSYANPCPATNITIKSVRAKWVDECRTRSCAYMQGAGELINSCPVATGVQIKMIGYDKTGNPIASKSGWPASTNNIAPGSYVFSLDHWLDYDSSIERFEVTVESTKIWNR